MCPSFLSVMSDAARFAIFIRNHIGVLFLPRMARISRKSPLKQGNLTAKRAKVAKKNQISDSFLMKSK